MIHRRWGSGLAILALCAPTAFAQERGLELPMSRDASGTAWQPDETPMYGVHVPVGRGEVMLHGNVFVGFDYQGSDRGAHQVSSPHRVMLMASHPLFGGEITARGMFSLEPLTLGGSGYPLLLQSGETHEGEPLHDRQHPHDLFMETALAYTHPITSELGVQLYAAPSGEPALGPAGFPHRASAITDPLAPISHHWQDATHITFGVLTAGVFTRHVKLEGSWFNGREPDEERYDFDLRTPDSYSARLSVNPHETVSMQVSYGFLESPEALEPDVSIHRVTASATHAMRIGAGSIATTAAWGRNIPSGEDEATDSLLLESNFDIDGRNIVFGRAEYVVKTGHDLVLTQDLEHERFHVGSLALGYLHGFQPAEELFLGLGARGSVNLIGERLEPFYGTRTPAGFMVFVQARPGKMQMEHAEHGAPHAH